MSFFNPISHYVPISLCSPRACCFHVQNVFLSSVFVPNMASCPPDPCVSPCSPYPCPFLWPYSHVSHVTPCCHCVPISPSCPSSPMSPYPHVFHVPSCPHYVPYVPSVSLCPNLCRPYPCLFHISILCPHATTGSIMALLFPLCPYIPNISFAFPCHRRVPIMSTMSLVCPCVLSVYLCPPHC